MKTRFALLSTTVPALLGALLMFQVAALAQPTPGPEHQALKALEGEWTATLKSPDGDTPGTMSAKMECGGFWLVSSFRTSFGGADFLGRGVDGFDPATSKHISVWVDSTITRPVIFEGTMDKAKKTLTMTA